MNYDIKDIKLATSGLNRIEWAERQMPVVTKIRERFRREKPLRNKRIAACLHITSETANLARTLSAGGASVFLCASNPLSTQDDVTASLVRDFRIPVFAIRGVNRQKYYQHIKSALSCGASGAINSPHITIDDGADLVTMVHSERREMVKTIIAGMEETTTGVIRLRAMERDNALLYPMFAVNDAQCKYLFDNRYGTGQSTMDGILRATNILYAGKIIVVCGYGWCGRGFAMRAKGLGARVVITEVNPLRALEAVMDGFEVMPMRKSLKLGDVFCTLTGNTSVIRKEHFLLMKNGAIVANSGHFNVEIDIPALEKLSKKIKKNIRTNVDEYILKNGKSIFLLGEGRLVNLACAEGHPATVMDMSFATQALTAEYAINNVGSLEPKVYPVPTEIEDWIAKLKLATMGIKIDTLTEKQQKYLSSWCEGT
ncbi:MAG: adenosylhomocysteinase [Planctomycetota bacterium]|nr:adenosylhomocysteinase [Planctomycetota bacterium]MDI6786927.1 adenosylhomocysteinase [Planctomycetota bacterium]